MNGAGRTAIQFNPTTTNNTSSNDTPLNDTPSNTVPPKDSALIAVPYTSPEALAFDFSRLPRPRRCSHYRPPKYRCIPAGYESDEPDDNFQIPPINIPSCW